MFLALTLLLITQPQAIGFIPVASEAKNRDSIRKGENHLALCFDKYARIPKDADRL